MCLLEKKDRLCQAFGSSDAYFAATVSMFAGMGIMALLDILVHKLDPQHDAHNSSDPQQFIASPEAHTPRASLSLFPLRASGD